MVDDWLAGKWPTVVARQQNYCANRGHYWQGLRTHTLTPSFSSNTDGSSVPDQLSAAPSDDPFNAWSAVFPEWAGVAIPCVIKVDVYSGPLGQGWCATVEVKWNNRVFRRAQNVGPESERTFAWTEFPAVTFP